MTNLHETDLPPGPALNRLIATVVCEFTGGLPDDRYPPFSTDMNLALRAVDAFLAYEHDVTFTMVYPAPEIWVKRYDERFTGEPVPVAYVTAETMPHAICLALLRTAALCGRGAGR